MALDLFVTLIFTTSIGAISGWVIGLLFGNAILGVVGAAGVTGVEMWQLGATLGFTGVFFRSHVSVSRN